MSEELKPMRVNTVISGRANKWLDDKSKELALTKSALVNIAIENYIKEIEVVHGLPKILQELERQGIELNI